MQLLSTTYQIKPIIIFGLNEVSFIRIPSFVTKNDTELLLENFSCKYKASGCTNVFQSEQNPHTSLLFEIILNISNNKMNIFFNSNQEFIFLEEVEHLLVHNSSDVILVILICVSILLVLMTNGSLIYFIFRQDLRTTFSFSECPI